MNAISTAAVFEVDGMQYTLTRLGPGRAGEGYYTVAPVIRHTEDAFKAILEALRTLDPEPNRRPPVVETGKPDDLNRQGLYLPVVQIYNQRKGRNAMITPGYSYLSESRARSEGTKLVNRRESGRLEFIFLSWGAML